jgi:hypothetical protein
MLWDARAARRIFENCRALLKNDSILQNGAGIPSVSLCRWADVVVVCSSSVLVEALLQGKVFMYLKYYDVFDNLFEEMNACWTIRNDEELVNAVRRIQHKKDDKPYSNEQVQRFLGEIIFGGDSRQDVLGRYVEFIKEGMGHSLQGDVARELIRTH